jgi:hypothetical protein
MLDCRATPASKPPLNGADERTPCAAVRKDSADEYAAPVERSLLNTAPAPMTVR